MATQPNIPNYQLSKAPEMQVAMIGALSQNLTAAMTALGKKNAAKKAEEKIIDKEARAVQNQFMAKASEVEGTLIGQMDAANRKWARDTGKELNALYTKAYGSNGTDKDKDAYLLAQSNAMANINVIATNATLVSNNQKSLKSNRNAKSKGSKNVFLYDDNYMYDEDGMRMYNEASNFGNGTYSDFSIVTNEKGHVVMSGKGMEDLDLNARVDAYKHSNRDLNHFMITKDDLTSTHSYDKYNKKIKPLLEADTKKVKITDYDGATRTWTTTSSVVYASLAELEEGNKQLSNQINQDLDNDKMGKWWRQMQEKPLNEGGVKDQPFGDLPWQFLNRVNDDGLKNLISDQDSYTAFDDTLDTDNDGNVDEQPREFAGFSDPTPSTGWEPEDLDKLRNYINNGQREIAAQAWLTEYQNYRPEGEKIQLEQERERTPGKGTNGEYTKKQIQSEGWSRQRAADYQKNVLPSVTELTKGGDLSAVAKKLQLIDSNKKGRYYLTGAELKSKYGGVDGLNDNEIYSYKTTSQNALSGMPKTTSITSDDFDDDPDLNTNNISQSLFNAYGYDPDTQYFLTVEGQTELGQVQ